MKADTVTVAVAVYNQARFLGDALRSIRAQTRPPDQVVVVDDGSTDAPERVTAAFPEVTLIRQANAGLSAARNTGMAHATGAAILFLDADDLLAPEALASGLACLAAHPGAAFVYGGHRRVDAAGRPIGASRFTPTGRDAHADLLRGNAIGMHATVLYDRATLLASGGFDERLRKCEDYDVYLRLTRSHPIAHHDGTVADYRIHGDNMSSNSRAMLQWVERVRARHRPAAGSDAHRSAWIDGRGIWRRYYAEERLEQSRGGNRTTRGTAIVEAMGMAPEYALTRFARAALRRGKRWAPAPVRRSVKRWLGRHESPPLHKVRMGDLGGVRPVSPDFGFDRGTPVDRYYIERFLDMSRGDIKGRVLEIGDAAYSRRFGTAIARQDVLHVDPDAPEATIVGDLAQGGVLPHDAFDCMIVTQTLHLIFDMRAAIRQMHDALRPGGVLLLTVPGITPVDRGDWGSTWFWSLTPIACERLFAEAFGPGNVTVGGHGNVYAATCFLQGMALEEVTRAQLDPVDPSFPVVATVRAVRAAA